MTQGLKNVMVASDRHDWKTPRKFFNHLNGIYRFTIDLFADSSNALLPRYYSKDRDALTQTWQGERAFGNPEYGPFIRRTLRKASEREASVSAILCPARVCTNYWYKYVWPKAHMVHLLKGRLTFEGANDPAPFESALVVYLGKEHPRDFGNARVVTGPLSNHPRSIKEIHAL